MFGTNSEKLYDFDISLLKENELIVGAYYRALTCNGAEIVKLVEIGKPAPKGTYIKLQPLLGKV
ncbi:MAG: hypothetical protein IJ211_06530 [Campylobacter sp.]|nr:hypothetical protein [Campylobacter sp.]